MKKILILGAGRGHVRLIKAAKEMNLYTIVVGLEGKYPGIALADKFVVADIKDKIAVLNIARENDVDGIIICASDTGLETLAFVSDKLGLYGLSYEAAKKCSDKFLMKQAFGASGVSTAKFIIFRRGETLDSLVNLSFPLMVKATDLQGSKGIYKVSTIEEARTAVNAVFSETKKEYCVIEEFIEGIEFGAQAYIENGNVKFVLPHGDKVFRSGTIQVPIGHKMPYDGIDSTLTTRVQKEIEKAAHALSLDNCAINADLILRKGEIFVIEITGRSGANCLAELTSLYYEFDYYKYQLLRATRMFHTDVKFVDHNVKCVAEMLFSEEEGEISDITFPENCKNVEITLFVEKGDSIRRFKSSNDSYGQIIVKGSSFEECSKLIDDTKEKIIINLKKKGL